MDTAKAEILDKQCQLVIDKCGLDGAVPWFMMASLLYYHADISILSDAFFDRIAREIYGNFAELKHPHKEIVGRDGFKAGSAYHLKIENYPMSVRGAAIALVAGKGYGMTPAKRDVIYAEPFSPPEYCWDTYTYGPANKTWREHLEPIAPPMPTAELPVIRVRSRVPVAPPVEEIAEQPTIRVRQRVRPIAEGASA